MITTLTRAASFALALALTTATTAQTRQDDRPGEPQQDQPQPGRIGQAEQAGQSQQQQDPQQQTVRGRITMIEVADPAARTGQESPTDLPGQAGQAGRDTRDAANVRATIMVDARGMMRDRPGRTGEANADEPGARPGADRSPQGGLEPRQQERPEAAGNVRAGLSRLRAGLMATYRFTVTDETLIQADEAGIRPGQAGAADRPNPDQKSSQTGQANRPAGAGLASPTEQPAQQEYRGLRAGQYVEVTYRPVTEAPLAGAGQPGQADPTEQPLPGQGQQEQPEADRPEADQPGQDPTARRPGQAEQAGQGHMIRGEAISIRVIPAPESEGGLDRPSPDGANQDRPGQPEAGQGVGTDRPTPIPTPAPTPNPNPNPTPTPIP